MAAGNKPPLTVSEQALRDDRQADATFAAALVLILVIVALLYESFGTITVILLLSGFFAYALLPLVDRLDQRMPRTLAVVVVALALVGLLTGVSVIFAPQVAHEISLLPSVAADTVQALNALWPRVHDNLPGFLSRFADGLLLAARNTLRSSSPNPSSITEWASAAASGVTSIASAIIFVPVFVFLMLRRFHATTARWQRAIPERWHPRFRMRLDEVDRVLSGFIRGQLLVAAIMGVLYGTAFTLIGIPLALVVGLLAGIGELAPFLGFVIAVSLGSLMALAGGEPTKVLWVLGTAVALHSLEASIINPWIVGSKAKVGPAIVIVALAIGAELFGVLGLLLAVPVAALLKVGFLAAFDAYRLTGFYRRVSS